jgi:hypothetical protein
MIWLRNFFNSGSGKIMAGVIVVVALFMAFITIKHAWMPAEVALERDRAFIDSETGKGFNHEIEKGEILPIEAPSGHKSGYPAELCYWTKEGTPKTDPTPVLLNVYLGKAGPTFCPDCGRLVVAHNPVAEEGMTPPPTKEQYEKRMASGK